MTHIEKTILYIQTCLQAYYQTEDGREDELASDPVYSTAFDALCEMNIGTVKVITPTKRGKATIATVKHDTELNEIRISTPLHSVMVLTLNGLCVEPPSEGE